jgi:transposase
MLNIGASSRIMLHRNPVDMRKSIDGLSFLVVNEFSANPADGSVYVFFNRSRDKLKLLYWDRNGFCVWYK